MSFPTKYIKSIIVTVITAMIFYFLLHSYIRKSDAYIESTNFILFSADVKNNIGQIGDYSLDSSGFRISNNFRVYFKYNIKGKKKDAVVTVWLVKKDKKWVVIHHAIRIL